MKISKSIETPAGTVRFEGELEAEELDYVIQVGLTTLFLAGSIKSKVEEAVTEAEHNTLQ